MTSTHRVVCAIDSQMAYALGVLLGSLKRESSKAFRVTVGYLEGSLPSRDRESVSSLAAALNIPLDFMPLPQNPLFITQGHISPTTFAKFLLSDAISDPHLWIDADTVALPGWDSIFDVIDATSEKQGLVVAKRGTSPGAPIDSMVFNAGVLGWPGGTRRNWAEPLRQMETVDTQEQALFNDLYSDTAAWVSEKYNTLTYRIDQLDPHDLPSIIHYAGAHKPWHLGRNLAQNCVEYGCPWSVWFAAEESLSKELKAGPLAEKFTGLQRAALSTGHLRWRRDHSGLWLVKLLTALGPGARIVMWCLGLLKQWVPRGTHPLH
jgi:lipopolysaccharide biosynthesis glycosyltransferase